MDCPKRKSRPIIICDHCPDFRVHIEPSTSCDVEADSIPVTVGSDADESKLDMVSMSSPLNIVSFNRTQIKQFHQIT